MAALAAAAAMLGGVVFVPANNAPLETPGTQEKLTTTAQQRGSNERAQKTPSTPTAEQSQAVLRSYGVGGGYQTRGCPWPGRRIACARRRAGSTVRMR